MSNDESPVDVAARDAASPGDPAPRENIVAEAPSVSSPTAVSSPAAARRRRSSAALDTEKSPPKRARSPKQQDTPSDTAIGSAPVLNAHPDIVNHTVSADNDVTPSVPPSVKQPSRRGNRKPGSTAEVQPDHQPDSQPDVQPGLLSDTTSSPVRKSRTRRQPSEPTAAPMASSFAPTETAVQADQSEPAGPSRSARPRRTPKNRAAAKSPDLEPQAVEPVEADLPAQEASEFIPPDAPPPARRRSTRGGRRRGGASPEAPGSEPLALARNQDSDAVAPMPDGGSSDHVAPAEQGSSQGSRSNRRGRGTGTRRRSDTPADLSRGARLSVRRGVVDLLIHGKPYPPVIFFGNMDGVQEQRRTLSEVQRAAQAGVHIHSTLVELICPLPPDDTVYETLDTRLQALIDADPQAFLIPRIVFVPANGWRKQYPNEVNHYADGTTDDPSIASDLFWKEAEYAMRAVVEHVRRMTYSERVIGYHLERGEWFHPVDGGYDRSYANREAFRNWLRQKYKNSEAALRASWYDGQVQFYTAEIPSAPASPRPDMAFFEPRKDRRQIDFLEYTSDITADRLISLARTIKDASENQSLVSVCYGYTFEFGHTFSGHLSLGKVLESSSIDILAGPPSYRDREVGGAGSLPSPVHSCAAHGKLWVTEDDTKTHLAPNGGSQDDFNPRSESRFATEQSHERALGKALAHSCGVAWMDTWGDGWLDSPEIWQSLGAGLRRYTEYLPLRKPPSPEVAIIVGEKSLIHVQRGDGFIRRILQDHREIAQKCGASIGYYLQSDVTARGFPTDAKLYLFVTPYRLTPEQRVAIKEKLQGGGKTLVWLYAPGTCDARGEPEESAHDLLGITLRQQSWNSEVGSRIVDSRHPIALQLRDKTFGVRERLNPSFYVDDDSPKLSIIAEYQQSGLPSIAVREMDGWRSVYCGEPTINVDVLRSLAKFAGAHLFTPSGEDYLFAGDGWITLHAVRDGQKVISLPQPMAVFDLTEGRLLGEDIREVRFFAKAQTTHRLFAGTMETLRKLGFEGLERAVRSRRGRGTRSAEPVSPDVLEANDVTLAPPHQHDTVLRSSEPQIQQALPEEEMETAVGHPLEIDEEMDEDPGSESEPTDAVSETEMERRRRRRRRGGRGRGRRGRSTSAPGSTGTSPGDGTPSS